MALLDLLRALHAHDLSRYRPFRVDGARYGWVREGSVPVLARSRDVFVPEGDGVALHPGLLGFGPRTRAVGEVVRRLSAEGHLPALRLEAYPVVRAFGEAPLFHVDRAAVAFLGLKAFGVHLNGYVRRPDGLHLWVARRAKERPSSPGRLDHLVAGGQPAGLTPLDNLVKESREEAGLPEAMARRARPAGTLSYLHESSGGLRDDTLHLFDLELPADFVPENQDGEVESFALWPASRVLDSLRADGGTEWKYNVGPAVLSFLHRHGLLPAGEPHLAEILALLTP